MSTVSDSDRHRLHNAFDPVIGEENANVLFELLPPTGWADVARTRDLEHLEARMAARFELVDARFEQIDARFELMEARFEAALERSLRRQSSRYLTTTTGIMTLLLAASQVVERLLG